MNVPLLPDGTRFADRRSQINFIRWAEALNDKEMRTPMLVITGPPASGKTHLAHSLFPSLLPSRNSFPLYSIQNRWNRALSLFLEYPSVIIDGQGHVSARELDCRELHYFLSAPTYDYREMHSSRMITKLNNTAIILTAGSIELPHDIYHRSCIVELAERHFYPPHYRPHFKL